MSVPTTDRCPAYASFFGVMGATSAMVFTGNYIKQTLFISLKQKKFKILKSQMKALGASYGTAKSSIGISASAVLKPEFIMKSVIPVVMAGIIAIYGLVVAVLITGKIENEYSLLT